MIFESIRLENLFSYYGQCYFDLSGGQPKRNIVLITGRNGFGKTSFLNSLRLLFGGVTESLREAVQRQRKPTAKQYVQGAGDDWWGILNRRAKFEGADHCSVQVKWLEERGQVTAERQWDIEGADFIETLSLQANFLDSPLIGKEAQEFISLRLPPDFVPFFIFNGEQIQELAEANRAYQIKQIERLLDISRIELLSNTLKDACKSWVDASMDQRRHAELLELEGKRIARDADLGAANQEMLDRKERLTDFEAEVRRIQRRLENRRAFVNQANESTLKVELANLEEEQVSKSSALVAELPRIAPLLLVPSLAAKASHLLEQQSDGGGQSAAFLRHLAASLPPQLFVGPPPPPISALSRDQEMYYRNRLAKLLEAHLPNTPSAGSAVLDISKADRARRLLIRYGDNEDLRQRFAADLARLFQIRADIRRKREELLNVSALGEKEREAYLQDQAEWERLQNEILALKVACETGERDINRLRQDLAHLVVAIENKRDEVSLSKKARSRTDIAKKLRDFFMAYKQKLKETRREELQEAINQHFRCLMTSHGLVAKITVDEDFGLHYQDEEGRPVGMGNLSAGMKQLAATALLWALKDCSGKPLPIVVDTPLARIDRGNQDNLLRNYYPVASQQVIILPTDSELDLEKYRLLKPFVYREYKLANSHGDDTRVLPETMYPEEIANA
ncbi:MAG: DNA sulfur modification protein DndD [Gammaproteobacteria bacterium]|nr:DNA sulfur modification protein DndD [Gammaproteobacteria bacterium]MBU1656368.1 DNA sulfur modification protein DndD [Gammaproteobacteria bacterium]MBU1959714.1 DNA sulfur modification protein DndD [Gammaproteobacteria bacterium]